MKGTGGAFGATAAIIPGAGRNPILWVGILLLLAAGVCVYLQLRRAAMICGIGGAALIVAAMLPAWGWIIIAVAAVGGGGFYIWAEKQHMTMKEALRATVEGIERAPAEAKAAVKAEVAKAADPSDSVAIAAIKAKDGL